jgi:hypothetical protein
MAKANDIYEFLVGQGTPSVLSGPWQNLTCHPGFFDLSGDAATRLSSLQSTFTPENLVKAGVAQYDELGNVTLVPLLAQDACWVLALRKKADTKPFELLINGQGISGKSFPWRAVMTDYRVKRMLESGHRQLVIAMSPADLAVLWTLGVAATTAAGLQDIGGRQLDSLCQALGIPRTPISAEDSTDVEPSERAETTSEDGASDAIPLVVADWSISTLDRTKASAAAEIVSHFRALHKFLEFAIFDFGIWNPSPEDIECLTFCVRYGSAHDVFNILRKQLESCESILETAGPVGELPATAAEAAATWFSADTNKANERQRAAVWNQWCQLQEIEVAQPLLQLSRNASDPIRRNLINTLASISRVFHAQAMAVADHFKTAVRNRGGNGHGALPEAELQQLLVLTDRTLAITRELMPCRSKHTLTFTSPPKPRRPDISANSSPSAQKKSPTSNGKVS